MTIYLETDRLRMRDWREEDFAPFAALNADDKVMKYFPARLNRKQSDAYIGRIQHGLDDNGFGFYAVEEKSTQRFIGFVGLSHVRFPAAFTPAVEIGWRLAVSAWGQGFATEAASACLANGFYIFGIREIVSFTAHQNTPSIAVMDRIGMTRNPADDFDHPSLPTGHKLRPHVLYRAENPAP
jgi:RimJ/RimL family protein N-acetyltransferase